MVIRDISCDGSESSLTDCVHNVLEQTLCSPLEDAGVVCQGNEINFTTIMCFNKSPPQLASTTRGDDCSDGEVRLEGGYDTEGTRQGRLEICFNRAWGTVCNESFSFPDARTACNQLVGFEREGLE